MVRSKKIPRPTQTLRRWNGTSSTRASSETSFTMLALGRSDLKESYLYHRSTEERRGFGEAPDIEERRRQLAGRMCMCVFLIGTRRKKKKRFLAS